MGEASTVSIVVCHWNAGVRTQRFLDQVGKWTLARDRFEILVQDNASSDGSSAALRQAVQAMSAQGFHSRFHRLEKHPGVTRAFNLALDQLTPGRTYVMRLDNDVTLAPDALETLMNFMDDHPLAGVTGPRILYSADPGRLNAGAIWMNRFGFRNRMEDPREPVECETLLGAVMLVRSETIRRVGRWFDSELFLFAEEPEFCWQAMRREFKVFYVPSAVAYHDTALSTGKHSDLSTYLNHRNHVVVLDRLFPGYLALLRNTHIGLRLIARCARDRTFIPFWGFSDGLFCKPLTEAWWQEQLRSSGFRRP